MNIWISISSFFMFLIFQAQGIVGGDSGDLVTAAATFGVPHPPGYPLYTFIGWIFQFLPLFTPSWRVGLISSLSHAIVLGIMFSMLHQLTRSKKSALFGVLTLMGNYLFFFYSVTPEVFALFDLFVVITLYFMVQYIHTKRSKYVYLLVFSCGLSLTHHHVILFLFPIYGFVVWNIHQSIRNNLVTLKEVVKHILIFFSGLLPYTYVYFAARGNSTINWDYAVTVKNFIRLITREDYGTFLSNSMYGSDLTHRILQIKAFGEYILMDYSILGIALLFVGIYGFSRMQRSYLLLFMGSLLCIGPVFLYYASFPLLNNFTLGTYERFLLPSYIFITLFIAYGYAVVIQWLRIMEQKYSNVKILHLIVSMISIVLFIYPLTLCGINIYRFYGMSQDQSADNLGKDILSSLPKNSILIIGNDTPLFITQYVRYALLYRPDVSVVHYSLLTFSDYRTILRRNFPNIVIPDVPERQFLKNFVLQNSHRFPLYSYLQIPLPEEYYLVPHGLVWEISSKDTLDSIEVMKNKNIALWRTFQNPSAGILSRYNHLMLADIKDVYAMARIYFGKTLLKAGDVTSAQEQFLEAIAYGGDTQSKDAYLHVGLTYLFNKDCGKALEAFSNSAKHSHVPDMNIALYQGITYRDCVKDELKSKQFFDEYTRLKKQGETPLQQIK